MITVNLKPGQRRKRAGNPLKGLLDNLSVFKELSAKIKDPLLMGAVGAWVLVIALLGLLYLNNLRQLYVLEPRLEQARSENRRFKTFLADKRRQEKIRDSLLAQITVIKSVDGDRYIWPHLLDEITKALTGVHLADRSGRVRSRGRFGRRAEQASRRKGRFGSGRPAAGADLPDQWPNHRHPGLHPVPAAAGSVALDHGRHSGLRHDGRGKGASGDGVHHTGLL